MLFVTSIEVKELFIPKWVIWLNSPHPSCYLTFIIDSKTGKINSILIIRSPLSKKDNLHFGVYA